MTERLPNTLKINLKKFFDTRYGENPHQRSAFYLNQEAKDELAIQSFKKIQGKEISFNNLLDIDAAISALVEIGGGKPASIIIKHTNPSGAAYGENIKASFYNSWQKGDVLASFGGIIGLNRKIDGKIEAFCSSCLKR